MTITIPSWLATAILALLKPSIRERVKELLAELATQEAPAAFTPTDVTRAAAVAAPVATPKAALALILDDKLKEIATAYPLMRRPWAFGTGPMVRDPANEGGSVDVPLGSSPWHVYCIDPEFGSGKYLPLYILKEMGYVA